jgi:hypothetical protein
MGKYGNYEFSRPGDDKRGQVHPIWRGIGCLFMFIIPLVSYAGAALLVRENMEQAWFQVPEELSGAVNFAPVYEFLPVLQSFLLSLGPIYYLDILLTVGFMIVGFGAISVVYSFMYRAVGPSRYGPYDSPPIRKSRRARSG